MNYIILFFVRCCGGVCLQINYINVCLSGICMLVCLLIVVFCTFVHVATVFLFHCLPCVRSEDGSVALPETFWWSSGSRDRSRVPYLPKQLLKRTVSAEGNSKRGWWSKCNPSLWCQIGRYASQYTGRSCSSTALFEVCMLTLAM